MNGKIVYDAALSGLSNSIDVRSMPESIYILELKFRNGQTKTSRVVVAR